MERPSSRILHRVKIHNLFGKCSLVLGQAVIEVFEVELFFPCNKCYGDIGLGLEVEVPEWCIVF